MATPDAERRAIPEAPGYAMTRDRHVWSSKRAGRPTARPRAAAWSPIRTHVLGRREPREYVVLWDGEKSRRHSVDDIHARLFANQGPPDADQQGRRRVRHGVRQRPVLRPRRRVRHHPHPVVRQLKEPPVNDERKTEFDAQVGLGCLAIIAMFPLTTFAVNFWLAHAGRPPAWKWWYGFLFLVAPRFIGLVLIAAVATFVASFFV